MDLCEYEIDRRESEKTNYNQIFNKLKTKSINKDK